MKHFFSLYENEENLYRSGFCQIAGIDEVGRGALAGPVVSAVVLLPRYFYHSKLNDSKKMTPKQRSSVCEVIRQSAIAYALAFVCSEVIDKINIRKASFLAMKKALSLLKTPYDCLLVDGEVLPDTKICVFQKAFSKGDSLYRSIAAASVLAKVARDQIMEGYGHIYKEYFFKKHKGYGTLSHRQILFKKGPSPIHRLTFEPLRSLKKCTV